MRSTFSASMVIATSVMVSAVYAQPAPASKQVMQEPGATGAPVSKSVRLVVQGFASPIPVTWVASAPSSSMRVAQYAIPAAKVTDAGELAVFFFPPNQGGSRDANIQRWTSQFTGANGQAVVPKVSTESNGGLQVTLVELQGTYARGVGMGPTGGAKPNQTLLVAMVETAVGRITLQMYGPSKTISAQRGNFMTLAKGFRPA